MKRLGVRVRQQSLLTHFSSVSTILEAREVARRVWSLMTVNPYGPGLESTGDVLGALEILGIDCGAETGVGEVGSLQRVVNIVVREDGDDRAWKGNRNAMLADRRVKNTGR